jgi:hypothetical protein
MKEVILGPNSFGVYNAVPPVLIDGQSISLQVDINGNLKTAGGNNLYTPTTPSDWGDVAPTDVLEALDDLASNDNHTTLTLLDNQATPVTFLSYPATSQARFLFFTLVRGITYDVGNQQLITDGSTVVGGINKNSIGSTGIVMSKTISGGNVLLQYTSTNTGANATLKYKWLAKF